MRARDIIEAVVRPNPRALKAYGRALELPKPEAHTLLKKHKIKIAGVDPAARSNLDVLIPGMEPSYMSSVGHELVHREQFRRAKANAKKANQHYVRKTSRFGDPYEQSDPKKVSAALHAYFEHPYEVMAYAYSIAQSLKKQYGARALDVLRSGEWKWGARDYETAHMPIYYKSGRPETRRLLKYVAAYLGEAETPKGMLCNYCVGRARGIIEVETPKSVFMQITRPVWIGAGLWVMMPNRMRRHQLGHVFFHGSGDRKYHMRDVLGEPNSVTCAQQFDTAEEAKAALVDLLKRKGLIRTEPRTMGWERNPDGTHREWVESNIRRK